MHWIKSNANSQERDSGQTQNFSLHKCALLYRFKIDLRAFNAFFEILCEKPCRSLKSLKIGFYVFRMS
jgi:hypothetical protein